MKVAFARFNSNFDSTTFGSALPIFRPMRFGLETATSILSEPTQDVVVFRRQDLGGHHRKELESAAAKKANPEKPPEKLPERPTEQPMQAPEPKTTVTAAKAKVVPPARQCGAGPDEHGFTYNEKGELTPQGVHLLMLRNLAHRLTGH